MKLDHPKKSILSIGVMENSAVSCHLSMISIDWFGPYLKSSFAGSLDLMEVMLCAQRASLSTLPQEIECTSITGACWALAEIKNQKCIPFIPINI